MSFPKKCKEDVGLEDSPYLLHPYVATLVTTKNKDGKANVLAVAWIIPVSVNPPCLALCIRPQRHSYRLLMENPEFVVNIPEYALATKVLYCGRRSGRDHDKFNETGLLQGDAKVVSVPIIEQCIAHIECRLERTVEIGDHILCVGRVVAAYALRTHFNKKYNLAVYKPVLHLRENVFTTTNEKAEDLTHVLEGR